jgi:ADP-heptose:LPS heptosyltransferase
MSVNKSNRVLLGMTQGVGNVIETTPLIRALVSMGLEVDIITDHIIRGAEHCLMGMKGVELLTEAMVADKRRIYLIGLQTFWPYPNLEKYVSQLRFVGNLQEVWKDKIPAHEVEFNMSLAYSLNYKGSTPSLYCNYKKNETVKFDADRTYIGINLCRKYSHQFLANRQLQNPEVVAEELDNQGYVPVLLGPVGCLGSEGISIYPLSTIDATGKDLMETAGIIKDLDCMISEDGGIGHMTAAMKTPLVSIFGPTSHTKNRPYTEKCIMITSDLECSPCQYTERQNQCFKNICMDIDASFVVQQVTNILK